MTNVDNQYVREITLLKLKTHNSLGNTTPSEKLTLMHSIKHKYNPRIHVKIQKCYIYYTR